MSKKINKYNSHFFSSKFGGGTPTASNWGGGGKMPSPRGVADGEGRGGRDPPLLKTAGSSPQKRGHFSIFFLKTYL